MFLAMLSVVMILQNLLLVFVSHVSGDEAKAVAQAQG